MRYGIVPTYTQYVTTIDQPERRSHVLPAPPRWQWAETPPIEDAGKTFSVWRLESLSSSKLNILSRVMGTVLRIRL